MGVEKLGLKQNENGTWEFYPPAALDAANKEFPEYVEAVPRYMAALEPLFGRAAEASEYDFILSLLRVRGMQDAGWDAFETTLRAIPKLQELANGLEDYEVKRHLGLWIYGHIYEASEPYELLANLLEIVDGGSYRIDHFPKTKHGTQPSPGAKIQWLEARAKRVGEQRVVDVIRDGWDNVFRNAAFHADYCLHGSHVRTLNPDRDYSGEQVPRLFNRAMAYFNCITALYKAGIERYEEPKVIPMPPYACQGRRDQTATVIVRQGHGVVGLMSWVATRDETFRALVGRFTPEESRLLDADQHLALLPARVARPGRD